MKDKLLIDGVLYCKVKESESGERTVSLADIRKYIKKHPVGYSGVRGSVERGYVKIPLPNCNTEWTFAVWDWVKAFVKEFPGAYPSHYSTDDTDEFQYVYLKNIEGWKD